MQQDKIRLVISDTHIGSLYSKESELLSLLQTTEFDELVLAGDIIDFIKVPTFTDRSARLFDFISSIDKPIIYIVGNHDIGFRNMVGSSVKNITFVDSYDFDYCGRKYRIQHGDQYDGGIVKYQFWMNFLSILHDFFERKFKFNLAAWWVGVSRKKHEMKRIWDIIKKWNEDADVFIMGHTHNPEAVIWVDKNERIKTYINTGDWIQNSTYVIIKDGQVRLKNFCN